MKTRSFIFSLIAATCTTTAFATSGIQIVKTDGETIQIANSDIRNLTFNESDAIITGVDETAVSINRSYIVDITPIGTIAKALTVSYSADGATVVNPYTLKGVTTEIDGAYVTVTNANTAEELSFSLEGTSTDGNFVYNGEYKLTLALNDLNLTSQRGAAIDIKCGKRIAVEVNGDNSLTDCAEGSQKACLYFKGHPEFSGSGTLTLTGNTNHALSSKEYIQFKKSFGSLNIVKAENDGIHAGQYFQLNGGKITVRNVKGDGIQAEVTNDETDENNGQMIIKGGTVDIEIGGDDSDCLKADNLITISGGTFKLASSGATAKGIKSKGAMTISGGEIHNHNDR